MSYGPDDLFFTSLNQFNLSGTCCKNSFGSTSAGHVRNMWNWSMAQKPQTTQKTNATSPVISDHNLSETFCKNSVGSTIEAMTSESNISTPKSHGFGARRCPTLVNIIGYTCWVDPVMLNHGLCWVPELRSNGIDLDLAILGDQIPLIHGGWIRLGIGSALSGWFMMDVGTETEQSKRLKLKSVRSCWQLYLSLATISMILTLTTFQLKFRTVELKGSTQTSLCDGDPAWSGDVIPLIHKLIWKPYQFFIVTVHVWCRH